MNRLEEFEALADHPWLGRIFKRLTQSDLRLAREFILCHEDKSVGEFELLMNRMFLDQKEKTKNYRIIQELLSCSNKKEVKERK